MIQFQYMAPWVPAFTSSIDGELAGTNNSPPFVTFQFATVDADGYPHNRTLVYRGFLFDDKSNNVITFTTDRRMDKYRELMHNDKFEAVFWFAHLKKQFRFRGRARIIDEHHQPTVDLSSIQPRAILEKHINSGSSSSSDEEDEIPDHLSIIAPHSKHKERENGEKRESEENEKRESEGKTGESESGESERDVQREPINYPLISPNLAHQIQSDNHNSQISYTNLHDMSRLEYHPPTTQEYHQELTRAWFNMSTRLQSTFRKPAPKSPMTSENQKVIDKISRGVDGNKAESGRKNFAVVAMFIDYVDLVEIEKDRRYIYRKDDASHYWSEEEVCP